jgi:segregation and condensation protein A
MTPEGFDTAVALDADRASTEPEMIVDVEGFEGPLDLLLTLARQQKVDLAKISILALADQYLVFIEAARKVRLELVGEGVAEIHQKESFSPIYMRKRVAVGGGASAHDRQENA